MGNTVTYVFVVLQFLYFISFSGAIFPTFNAGGATIPYANSYIYMYIIYMYIKSSEIHIFCWYRSFFDIKYKLNNRLFNEQIFAMSRQLVSCLFFWIYSYVWNLLFNHDIPTYPVYPDNNNEYGSEIRISESELRICYEIGNPVSRILQFYDNELAFIYLYYKGSQSIVHDLVAE